MSPTVSCFSGLVNGVGLEYCWVGLRPECCLYLDSGWLCRSRRGIWLCWSCCLTSSSPEQLQTTVSVLSLKVFNLHVSTNRPSWRKTQRYLLIQVLLIETESSLRSVVDLEHETWEHLNPCVHTEAHTLSFHLDNMISTIKHSSTETSCSSPLHTKCVRYYSSFISSALTDKTQTDALQRP